MSYQKGKFSFKLNGIQYNDIPGYRTSPTELSIGVAGTATMVRQYLNTVYGISGRDFVSVKSESFAGGDSIRVGLNNAPAQLYSTVQRDLDAKFEEGSFDAMQDIYNYTKGVEEAEDGQKIRYGTKYLTTENSMPYGSTVSAVDWTNVAPKTGGASASGGPGRYGGGRGGRRQPLSDNGTLLRTCGGWGIYRKQLPDGTMVVNAVKERSTTSNRGAWVEIRGALLTEANFTWNKRYQLFENRTLASSSDAELNEGIDRLCRVLRRYYIDDTATQAASTSPTPVTPPVAPQPPTQPAPPSPPSPAQPQASYPVIPQGVPPNSKLEYCRITGAEGLLTYSDLYPRDFSSWTELTRFIRLNIPEVPTSGYDKHFITYKWKFEANEESDRWDVCEVESDPRKYPNLYAFNYFLTLCYDAWKTDVSTASQGYDTYTADEIGKDGLELDDRQFNELLNELLVYYKKDKNRFRHNTPEERLQAFKDAYPKTYAMFNSPAKYTRQDVERKIAVLQVTVKYNPSAASLIQQLQAVLRYI
jgi:hypothetical protein